MKKKILFIIILVITIFGISLFLSLTFKSKPIENITPLPTEIDKDLLLPQNVPQECESWDCKG